MAREVARIPPDLRDRKDLTLADIERVQAIRTKRKRLETRRDGWSALEVELTDQITQTRVEEREVLGGLPALVAEDAKE